MMTCSDVLENVRTLLKDIPQAEAEIDWYDDDTHWHIEVYVSKGYSETHARVLNTMIKNGYALTDFENNTEEDDNHVIYSSVYWFN